MTGKLNWLRKILFWKKSNQYNSGVAQTSPKYFLNTQIKLGPTKTGSSTPVRFLRISGSWCLPDASTWNSTLPLYCRPRSVPLHSCVAIATPSHSLRCCHVTGLAGDIRRAGAGLCRGLQHSPDQAVTTDGHAAVPRLWALTATEAVTTMDASPQRSLRRAFCSLPSVPTTPWLQLLAPVPSQGV